jgi:hypothetical protein
MTPDAILPVSRDLAPHRRARAFSRGSLAAITGAAIIPDVIRVSQSPVIATRSAVAGYPQCLPQRDCNDQSVYATTTARKSD